MKLTLIIRWIEGKFLLSFYILLVVPHISIASTVLFDDYPQNGTSLWSTSSSESNLTQIDEPVAGGDKAIVLLAHHWTQSGLHIAQVPPYEDTILEAKIYRKAGSKGTLMFRRGENSLKINLDESNSEFWTINGQPGHNDFLDDTWHTIQIHLKHFNLNEGENVLAVGIQGPYDTGVFYMDSVYFKENKPVVTTGPPVLGNWILSFEDDFNQNTLNPDKWKVGKQYLGMSGLAANAGSENISVENGMLKFKAEKESFNQGDKTNHYKGAEISTFGKFRQQYGYFEAKIKYDSVHGTWPAFWLLADKGIYGSDTYRRQALLKFSLEGISDTVDSAFLKFKVSKATDKSSVAVHKTLSSDWLQSTVTWDTKPKVDPIWFIHRYGASSGDIVEVDVTEYVKAQKIAGNDASFSLVDNYMKGQLLEIFSNESENYADRPLLAVNGTDIGTTDDATVRGGEYSSENFGDEPNLLVKDMWGDTSTTFGRGMEFDIMEYLGVWDEDVSCAALHWDGYGSEHASVGSDKLYFNGTEDDFHLFGMHWAPNYVGIYIDGEKVWEHESERIGSLPSYIILSLQVGGWDGNTRNIDDDFVATMLVDYVKVWENQDNN
ncbi:DNRLRE domain-containing protein [Pseudoalteromonas sp. 31A1]|uniref:CBM96 family carbohydrate-binding protein n=1 Tax=Pseudoalteromonas sp. 31A1 TaxID=2686351 RepID=UPI0013FE2727|nr:DNRLRE domain-containing protein [Pseudoalteromonas sp. 31A1]